MSQSPSQLPLFPADSHANRLAARGDGEAGEIVGTSGRTCFAQYVRLTQGGSWLKTFRDSFLTTMGEPSSAYVMIWNLRATKSFRWYIRLTLSARPTRGSAYSSLPTLIPQMWPTPKVSAGDYTRDGGKKGAERPTLSGAVKLWPTARAAIRGRGKHRGDNRSRIEDEVHNPSRGSVGSGTLNPTWVEWLMGFPIDWTASNASGTR